ncbi:MAG: hypothetical protein UT40_C0018G0032 [Candidatus Woesebacteria bacterium GW2011_GWA1_39_21b]|uniref:Uncharacterized protein n=1 Tax=Candidatus Woesebacteria bacterium GW2011_GWA1_39_21b TaxID=1618551 RepID=A0A0G0RI98_9BACT|nr:MAG: hypothetical protein UT40_C0018G0032 [Candidatus Woesebacteria bacterium GW2011_GWA1_39_21b]
MLSKALLAELKLILKEEFNLEFNDDEVAKLARNLVGYFSLLAKIHYRNQENEANHA